MAVSSDFIKKTQPANILDVISQELLERLLDSYCFLSKTPLAIYYPTGLPVTKDNLKPLELIYGDPARLDPLNFPFCLGYRKLCQEYDEAYKKWDKKIVMRYYNGDWKEPKLFHSYLWLWEMTYPLYAGGRLVAVQYAGEIVVREDVANWRDVLKETSSEIVWDPADEASKIPEKSNQAEEIRKAIDNNKDIHIEDKEGLKESLRKAVEDQGVKVDDLVGRYEAFKGFGKSLEGVLRDLYDAKAEAARREHIHLSSRNLTGAGDQIAEMPERFWNTLDEIVENTLPYVKGYVFYKPDKYSEGFEPVRTCIYDKELISGDADFRNFCRQVFDELHEKGKKKKELIVYDLLDENVPRKKFRDLFECGVSDSSKIAGGASVFAIPLAETENKIIGGLVCVCAREEKAHPGEIGISEGILEFYVETIRDIADVLSMVLARHEAEETQADAWAIRSHELIAPIHAVKGYTDNLDSVFKYDIQPLIGEHEDVRNKFVGRLHRLAGLCNLQELIATSTSLEGKEEVKEEECREVRLTEEVLLPIVQPLRDFGHAEKNVTVWFSEQLAVEIPKLHLFVPKMKRCVFNIVFNAIKYSKRGTRVEILLGEKKGKEYRIHIVNEGIGVPEGEEERIFRRFARGSNASESTAYGAGLGLYVARQIARFHGGDVRLVSGKKERTVFALILPDNLRYGILKDVTK